MARQQVWQCPKCGREILSPKAQRKGGSPPLYEAVYCPCTTGTIPWRSTAMTLKSGLRPSKSAGQSSGR